MQKLTKTFEDIMVAITFAEVGEYDNARKITDSESEADVAADVLSARNAAEKA